MSKQSFEDKAMTARGVTGVFHRETAVEGIGELTGTTIKAVEATGIKAELETRVIVMNDMIFVGSITESSSQDKAEVEAEGRVHLVQSSAIRIGPKTLTECCAVVGIRYSYGDPFLMDVESLLEEQAMRFLSDLKLDKGARKVVGRELRSWQGITDMKGLFRHVIAHFRDLNLDRLAGDLFGYGTFGELPEDLRQVLGSLSHLHSDEAHLERWKRGLEVGRIGNPFACLVDVYEHGLMSFQSSQDPLTEVAENPRHFCIWEPEEDDVVVMEQELLSALSLPADCIMRTDLVGANSSTTYLYEPRRDHGDRRPARQHVTWVECLETVLTEAGRAGDIEKIQPALRKIVAEYAKPELEEYTDFTNGAVYDGMVHVIDRATGEVFVNDSFDTIVGMENAIDELEASMLGAVGYQHRTLAA